MGNISSDRLGYNGSGHVVTKRYLAGGINGSTNAYNNTSPVVGITQAIALPNTDEERRYLLDSLGNWEASRFIPVGGEPTVDLRQHNKQNQITSRKEETKVLFTYDKNGNLKDDGTLLYDYDALNRLTQVRRKSNGQTIGQYGYDAQNRRARKTVSNGGLSGNIPNGTIDFIYRDWQVMEERSGSTVNKQYVWGNYFDECNQLRTYVASGAGNLPAGTYYPLQDLLYRTKALTNDEGEIAEAYDYDAYGNTLIFSEAGAENNWWSDDAAQASYAACEVLYAGYRYDAESRTYQVRNRRYNPQLGRWVQRDPIGFEGGDWNLYEYVENNPITLVDPEGLKQCDPPDCDTVLEECRKDVFTDVLECAGGCAGPGALGEGGSIIACSLTAFLGGAPAYKICAVVVSGIATYGITRCLNACVSGRDVQMSSCYCAYAHCLGNDPLLDRQCNP